MKPFWQSKTFIVNLIAAVVACLLALQGTNLIMGNPQLVAWIGAALAAANIVLRFLTVEPVMATLKRRFNR